jgi:hypothetical protein
MENSSPNDVPALNLRARLRKMTGTLSQDSRCTGLQSTTNADRNRCTYLLGTVTAQLTVTLVE